NRPALAGIVCHLESAWGSGCAVFGASIFCQFGDICRDIAYRPVPEAGTGWGVRVEDGYRIGFGAFRGTGPGEVWRNILAVWYTHVPGVLCGWPFLALCHGGGCDAKFVDLVSPGELIVADPGKFVNVNHVAPFTVSSMSVCAPA